MLFGIVFSLCEPDCRLFALFISDLTYRNVVFVGKSGNENLHPYSVVPLFPLVTLHPDYSEQLEILVCRYTQRPVTAECRNSVLQIVS